MESMSVVLYFRNRGASFTINGKRVKITMKPDYVHEDPGYKSGPDSEDFTLVTSGRESEAWSEVKDTQDEELILMIHQETVREYTRASERENETRVEKLDQAANSSLGHWPKRQSERIK